MLTFFSPPLLRLGLTQDCCQPTGGTITPTLGTISVGLLPLPERRLADWKFTHFFSLCREMSVSVRTDGNAAELLTRPESAGDLQHWLHQHGGKDHARQQGPVQVGVDAVESPPAFVLLPFFKKNKNLSAFVSVRRSVKEVGSCWPSCRSTDL